MGCRRDTSAHPPPRHDAHLARPLWRRHATRSNYGRSAQSHPTLLLLRIRLFEYGSPATPTLSCRPPHAARAPKSGTLSLLVPLASTTPISIEHALPVLEISGQGERA
ncbi:hypothetical protein DFH08DRAFT_965058 [Mycena albidolilacea]|uniref:Uncharacterized protein n=1 Tax=Mycena albidolilacea TaxID=1033008 RepID=A0AAD7EKX3_9AGAR|nr:hypothetical protein DFH08DRAFT_965058 [Mycena albidolilacea]